MRSFTRRAAARSFSCTARQSCTCKSAITEPLPESRPLQPSTSEAISQVLCVVSTLTGGVRDCSARMWRSCSCGFEHQSLIARTVGTASRIFESVASG